MARINIEDSLWADPRFQELMVKTGNRFTAKGMILELISVAQRYWLSSGGKGIPKPAWQEIGLPDALIECRLARDDGDFVYAVGSKDQFAWLEQRSEAGKTGGKESGKARRKTTGKSAKRNEAEGERNETERSGTKPPSLPPSLPPSPSLPLFSDSNSISEEYSVGENAVAPPPVIKSPVGYFIGTYVKAFKERYGEDARPEIGGKVQGQIRRYVEETPTERACEMIRMYCEMSDPWFLTKGHDFATFLANLNKVGIALDTGRTMTRSEIKHAESTDYYKNQLKRIQEGTL